MQLLDGFARPAGSVPFPSDRTATHAAVLMASGAGLPATSVSFGHTHPLARMQQFRTCRRCSAGPTSGNRSPATIGKIHCAEHGPAIPGRTPAYWGLREGPQRAHDIG